MTLGYARVPHQIQKQNLKAQSNHLRSFCTKHDWDYELIQDLGSGVNDHKSGLRRLIQRLCDGNVERLVMTNRDRLLRFGVDLVFALCEHFQTEVVIRNINSLEDFEDDIAEDILETITVFSAHLDGTRHDKNQKIIDNLMAIARELAE
ncbi:IS607 family transposase [Phormidium sp. FACHB-592]|uniref:IS607 family transposase n=1 Tax=Stenomitos frigidus AS-A4 TaxID=2933935 RepID=A0ABV0KWI0_9CYAN|nr:IS607 family transposase [Phormidium sp. FACHB-592]